MGNLILRITKSAQPGRRCGTEKQEEQMQHRHSQPLLLGGRSHAQAGGLCLSGHPAFPQQWQHLAAAVAH